MLSHLISFGICHCHSLRRIRQSPGTDKSSTYRWTVFQRPKQDDFPPFEVVLERHDRIWDFDVNRDICLTKMITWPDFGVMAMPAWGKTVAAPPSDKYKTEVI